MTTYFLDNIVFNVYVKTNSEKDYDIIAIANNAITFEANFVYCGPDATQFNAEKNKIIKAISTDNIKLNRCDLAQEYALSITFEYYYTENGEGKKDWYSLYYQPHFTIEEAIKDALIVKNAK